MPSPIVYTDIPQYNAQADVCDKLELLLRTSDRFRDFLEYAFDVAGNVSTEFAEDIAKAVGPLIGVPVGAIIWRPVTAVPDGYVIANGQSLLRTDYADLFAVYGTAHGSDSATTFKVPNLYDRFLIGGGSTYVIGSTYGAATVELSEENNGPHTHDFTVIAQDEDAEGQGVLTGGDIEAGGEDGRYTGVTEESGEGAPFSIIPPCMAGLWLVKT